MKRILPILLLLPVHNALTQTLDSLEIEVRDSLRISTSDTIIYPKPKAAFVSNALFQFTDRNERYYGNKARMNGLRLGLEFFRRYRTGVGIYANNHFYPMHAANSSEAYRSTARLSYTLWFSELVLYRSFRWEVVASYAQGKAQVSTQTFDHRTSIPTLVKEDTISSVPLNDFGMATHFKVFPWFGIGFGAGYRQLGLSAHPELQGPFTGPYFDFKVKIFLGYAYRAIFKPEKIKAERLYYEQRSRIRRAKFRKTFLER